MREAAREDGIKAGRGFWGLSRLLRRAHEELIDEDGDRSPGKLLDCLAAATIDRRVAKSSPEIFGVSPPRALVVLGAHEILLQFARRHQLVEAADAAASQEEIARPRGILTKALRSPASE